jgi:hypothetical protein
MKVHYECAACFLRQAREALDLATDDDSLKMDVTEKVTKIVCRNFHPSAASNVIGTEIHRTIKRETKNSDPYSYQRDLCNEIAMKILPKVQKIVEDKDGLESYLKAAIAGNIIDFGAMGLDADMESIVTHAMNKGFAVNDSKKLEEELKRAKTVLYLADNIGEIVFDKLLIKKLHEYDVDVTVALKENPILNDACMEDALKIGLDEVAELTTTGTDSVGVIYSDVSPQFRKAFDAADMVIAKGLGNYEGLGEMDLGDKPVFSLLNAKCDPVAREIGVKKGDNVVLKF